MQEIEADAGSILGSGRSPGGGHGNPLWYSCLENPMDRGAWQAMGHGVTESDPTEATKHAHRGVSLGNPRKGPVAPKFISPCSLLFSVLLLSAAPGLRPGRAGLPVGLQGSLQVSGPKGVGRTQLGWARPPTLTPCPSPLSFKEWTLTTSLAQWPSEVSEVSSLPTLSPWHR